MERERLQVLAQLVKRKDTLWKNIPVKSRTIKQILTHKEIKKQNGNSKEDSNKESV
jgi:hypothetical protein